MPVNTAALKTFAPAMRRKLLEAVGRKLDLLLNSQTPDTLSTYAKQIAELRQQEADNREQLLERVAYTWFNRLCALRYLDARGWHPFGCKVLMPAAEGETQPELLKLMRAGSLPAELKPHTNEARLHGLLDGQIPPAVAGADPQGEVYRELVLASCRSYHQLLPELFEGVDDSSELLMPDDLLSEGSISGGLRSAISDSDCEDVEIIGWLYQYFISEQKEEIMKRKTVVRQEDIPAATQLFTPDWVVRYLVENTLGRIWIENHKSSRLSESLKYLDRHNINTETKPTRALLSPEQIKFLDPACGSGHILVYAFDVFAQIYEEQGYSKAEIPALILSKNLYGLDISERASQLACFALICKAREYTRQAFNNSSVDHVQSLRDVQLNSGEIDFWTRETGSNLNQNEIEIIRQFRPGVSTFGSLLNVRVDNDALAAFKEKLCLADKNTSLLVKNINEKLKYIANQAENMSAKYDAVVTNPPYMGSRKMCPQLGDFLKKEYLEFKSDLFSAFMQKCSSLAFTGGYVGIMSPNVWMYISSHEELRKKIIESCTLLSLLELPVSWFKSASVQICAFTMRKGRSEREICKFIRLVESPGDDETIEGLARANLANESEQHSFAVSPHVFEKLPGSCFAYWVGSQG
jgi:hypothetical protein